METLPDTLVVRILSKVGDGLMLLDVLPLVCQRWRRLCRDHAAWAEVDVDCDGMDESDTGEYTKTCSSLSHDDYNSGRSIEETEETPQLLK